MRHPVLLLCLLAMACTPSPPAEITQDRAADETSFQEVVAAHTAAIQERDLDALVATVTTGDSLPVIFPEGIMIQTRQEYIDFHRDWFADDTWTMELEPVSTTLGDGFGVALLRSTYTDDEPSRKALLALTFARERDGWRLVFDQNTRIAQ